MSALGSTVKIEFFKNISRHCTTLYFGILNDHVKRNYKPKIQGCSTVRGGVLLKIFFKAF